MRKLLLFLERLLLHAAALQQSNVVFIFFLPESAAGVGLATVEMRGRSL
jgi:hypothetical protein